MPVVIPEIRQQEIIGPVMRKGSPSPFAAFSTVDLYNQWASLKLQDLETIRKRINGIFAEVNHEVLDTFCSFLNSSGAAIPIRTKLGKYIRTEPNESG